MEPRDKDDTITGAILLVPFVYILLICILEI